MFMPNNDLFDMLSKQYIQARFHDVEMFRLTKMCKMNKVVPVPKRRGRNAIQGVSWAWFAFFTQIPFVFWYAKGRPALHPITVILPLVGLLNFKIENRGPEGLGLRLRQPGPSLLLALIYAMLSVIGWFIGLRSQGVTMDIPLLTTQLVWDLLSSFLTGVFIIALWEEILNRGYIQTRLQAGWGFWGVIVTSLLFGAMHIPSAVQDYDSNILKIALRFTETGMVGFALGYIYWRTGSVITTIVVHGLNNFVGSLLPIFSGIPPNNYFLTSYISNGHG